MKSTVPSSSDGHEWAPLAIVRIVLASIVLTAHAATLCVSPAWIRWLGDFGATTAVFGFFVVSGYCIAHSIDRRPEGFYQRRLERIYPVFLASFLIALIPYVIWGWNLRVRIPIGSQAWEYFPNSGPWDVVGTLFFLNGFLSQTLCSLGAAWSLSLEVFFYALAPLLMRFPSPLLLFLIVGSIAWRLNPALYFGENYPYAVKHIGFLSHGAGVPVVAWAWLLGFLFYRHRQNAWAKQMLLLLGLLPVVCISGAGNFNALTYAFVASVLIAPPKLPERLVPCATYLGDLSYPIYLVQAPVLVMLAANDNRPSCWYFLVFTILASVLVLHLVDYPAQRYFRRCRLKGK